MGAAQVSLRSHAAAGRTFKYVSRLKETVRNTRNVQIAAGGSNFALPTQEPGDFILVLRNSAGAELNRLSYSVAGEANISRSLERNAELQIQLDKPAYAGGDTISVSIRAPYAGAGLITIERERVFLHQWFKTSTTSSVQRVTLPAGFEGNGYVAVQFLRDPASDEIFMSPLSYGVAPFAADLSGRTSRCASPRPQVKPGAVLTMHVAPAEASRVAVFAVDEGILAGGALQESRSPCLLLPEAHAAGGNDADSGSDAARVPALSGARGSRRRRGRRLRAPPQSLQPQTQAAGGVVVGNYRRRTGGRDLRYTVPDYFNGRLRIVPSP
jgi:alpha-2-macroglobulin